MKIIVGNWKMNGDVALVNSVINEINEIGTKNKIIICPPAPLIGIFKNFHHSIGAQNCFYEQKGAFTGENSPALLRELGCEYVLVGHSERRTIFCESDDVIFRKWQAIVAEKMVSIVCIGEKLEERNDWRSVLSKQLENYVGNSNGTQKTIFAYEPIWSIGTGLIPTNDEIETAMEFIGNILTKGNQGEVSLLYGGSVNAGNAAKILSCKNVDGVLVGGASLKIDEFKDIIKSA